MYEFAPILTPKLMLILDIKIGVNIGAGIEQITYKKKHIGWGCRGMQSSSNLGFPTKYSYNILLAI